MKLYKAHKVALIYPSMVHHYKTGNFFDFDNSLSNQECSILSIDLNENSNEWQEDIYHRITGWAFP